jgi:hypothetical protein
MFSDQIATFAAPRRLILPIPNIVTPAYGRPRLQLQHHGTFAGRTGPAQP